MKEMKENVFGLWKNVNGREGDGVRKRELTVEI